MSKETIPHLVKQITGGKYPGIENVILHPLLRTELRNTGVTLYNVLPVNESKHDDSDIIILKCEKKELAIEMSQRIQENKFIDIFILSNKIITNIHNASVKSTEVNGTDIKVTLEDKYKPKKNTFAGYSVDGMGGNDGIFSCPMGTLKNRISQGDYVYAGKGSERWTLIALGVVAITAIIGYLGYSKVTTKKK